MAIFNASWYNYIAQEEMVVKINAKDIIEAKEAMILYMNNCNGAPSGTKYTESDIDYICEDYPDTQITLDEEFNKYKTKYKKDPPDEIMNWEDKDSDIEFYRN